jgi:hypothetical protein
LEEVPAPEELERTIARQVSSRDLKNLAGAVALISHRLDPTERVLGAAAGLWFGEGRCLVVVTSRSLTVADSKRIESVTYAGMLDCEYSESWRKGQLVTRAPGVVVDIRDIHLDRARELNSVIQTARTNQRYVKGPSGLILSG